MEPRPDPDGAVARGRILTALSLAANIRADLHDH